MRVHCSHKEEDEGRTLHEVAVVSWVYYFVVRGVVCTYVVCTFIVYTFIMCTFIVFALSSRA